MEPTKQQQSSKTGDDRNKYIENMTRKQLKEWRKRESTCEKLEKKYNAKINSLDGAIDIILPINEELTKKLLELCDSYTNNIVKIKELFEKAFKNGERIDVDYINEYGKTALLYTSLYGHAEIVELLLKHGAKPNIQNNHGETALIKASYYGHIAIVKLLLEYNADPHVKNKYGRTAVMWASKNDNFKIVKLLLEYDVDINVQDEDGNTALTGACECESFEIVDLLLNNGAKLNLKNDRGETALMIASNQDDIHTINIIYYHTAKSKTVTST